MDRGDEAAMERGGVEGEFGSEWRNCKFKEDLGAFLQPLMRENRKVFVHGDATVFIFSPKTATPTLLFFFFFFFIKLEIILYIIGHLTNIIFFLKKYIYILSPFKKL